MEIERKFLITDMPDLKGLPCITHERYFLVREDRREERIQRKGDKYEYEIKETLSSLERTKDVKIISETEFNQLKEKATEGILRDSYKLPNGVSLKVYHGRFEGLVRAEIEFSSVEEARAYTPRNWMGEEITESPLGKDGLLLGLTDEEFYKLLKPKV